MASREGKRDNYMFNRDCKASVRLNYNHWLMKSMAGYLIHPSIPTDKPNLRIADVGAGTGIWSLEVSAMLPTAQIDGFDISADQFPAPTLRPKNVHLHVHDCFKPFPNEFLGAFDVVHARFWLCIVNNPEAPVLLENFLSLLKPGGHFAWFEPLPWSVKTVLPTPDFKAPAMDRMTASWRKPKPDSTYDWVEGLPGLFRENGLEVIAEHRVPMGEQYRHVWMMSAFLGLQDMVEGMQLQDVGGAEAIVEWVKELTVELAQGACNDVPWFCVVGRKSS